MLQNQVQPCTSLEALGGYQVRYWSTCGTTKRNVLLQQTMYDGFAGNVLLPHYNQGKKHLALDCIAR